MFSSTNAGYGVSLQNIAVVSGATNFGSGRGHIYGYNSTILLNFTFIKGIAGGTADGILVNSGIFQISATTIDGYNSSNKLPNGIRAINGGTCFNTSVTFGSNITTQKNPANWAASTDGSYIS